MAYTQDPGRSKGLSTGNGLPKVLLQIIDGPKTKSMKKQVAGKKGFESFQDVAKATKFATTATGESISRSGLKFDSRTGETTGKDYEKKFVVQPGGDAFIVDGGGKTIASAKANKFNSKEVDALKKKYESDKKFTEDSRMSTATAANAQGQLGGGFTNAPTRQLKRK
jgi:hypothetical protein